MSNLTKMRLTLTITTSPYEISILVEVENESIAEHKVKVLTMSPIKAKEE